MLSGALRRARRPLRRGSCGHWRRLSLSAVAGRGDIPCRGRLKTRNGTNKPFDCRHEGCNGCVELSKESFLSHKGLGMVLIEDGA